MNIVITGINASNENTICFRGVVEGNEGQEVSIGFSLDGESTSQYWFSRFRQEQEKTALLERHIANISLECGKYSSAFNEAHRKSVDGDFDWLDKYQHLTYESEDGQAKNDQGGTSATDTTT